MLRQLTATSFGSRIPVRLRYRLAIFIIKKLVFFIADKRPLLGPRILEMIKQLTAGRAGDHKRFPIHTRDRFFGRRRIFAPGIGTLEEFPSGLSLHLKQIPLMTHRTINGICIPGRNRERPLRRHQLSIHHMEPDLFLPVMPFGVRAKIQLFSRIFLAVKDRKRAAAIRAGEEG